MKITYDPSADAMYIRLKEGERDDTVVHDSGLIFDVDAEGNVLGIEILAASIHLDNPRQIDFKVY